MAKHETAKGETNKFSKSVGAGVKSVFGGGGKSYYILEHKVTSDKYSVGEKQEIIVDYIELGRNPNCQVKFGDQFPTVSGRHAAITKEGNNWVIKHLSEKNPTLLNGRPIAKQWFLQNGDEIQLSVEGPKIGFLIPTNNSVKSINMSRRLSLFRKQALRPYKNAIAAISIVFLLALGGGAFYLIQQKQKVRDLKDNLEMMSVTMDTVRGNADSLKQVIADNEQAQEQLRNQLGHLSRIIEDQNEEQQSEDANHSNNGSQDSLQNDDLRTYFPSVYFILAERLKVSYQGETEEITDYQWAGTGFLLKNKKFITARHVIEPWMYISNQENQNEAGVALNMIDNNDGEVIVSFKAYSPDGTVLSFKNTDFRIDRTTDITNHTTDNEGNRFILVKAEPDFNDWAVYNTDKTGNIETNYQRSESLEQGDDLHILGYPMGIGADSPENISPLYSTCPVAQDGLHDGVIRITGRSFDQGNSGGPVFYLNEQNIYKAVGIISAGIGESVGFIVPVSEIEEN